MQMQCMAGNVQGGDTFNEKRTVVEKIMVERTLLGADHM